MKDEVVGSSNSGGRGGRGHEDEPLVEAALAGNKEALTRLVLRHYRRVFGYLLRLSGEYHLAQDLTQETFYRAWRALPGKRAGASFERWLYRIAHNTYVDQARSWERRRVRPSGDLRDDDTAGPGEASGSRAGRGADPDPVASAVEENIERSRAAALLRRLAPLHRSVVILRYYEQLSLPEIGEVLNLKVGTVKSRLHYAFRQLRRLVADEERGVGHRRNPSSAESVADDTTRHRGERGAVEGKN